MAGDGKVYTSKETKKSWKSKTILVNAAVAAAAVVAPEVVAMVPVEYQVFGMAAVNIFLRFLTDKGVSFK